jgi:hypothetical protein
MINVKLLVASALVVKSGAFLVVLSTFLQLYKVKPTEVSSAPAGRQVISTTLAAPQFCL